MKSQLLFSLIAGSLLRAEVNWDNYPPPPDSSYVADIEVFEVPAGTVQKGLAGVSMHTDFPSWGISKTRAADIVASAKRSGTATFFGKERVELFSRKRTTVSVSGDSSIAGKATKSRELVKLELTSVSDSGSLAMFLRVKRNPSQHEKFREPDLEGAYLFCQSFAESMVISCGAGNPKRELLIHIATMPGGPKSAVKAPDLTLAEYKLDRASLFEGIETLRRKAFKADPRMGNINFVVFSSILSTAEMTLELRDVTFSDALRYLTELAGFRAYYGPYAILIGPEGGERNMEMMTMEFRAPDDAVLHEKLANAKPWLASLGVMLPEGASAKFDPKNGNLKVVAVQDALEMADAVLIAYGGGQAHPPRATKAWQQAEAITLSNLDIPGLNVRQAVDILERTARANVKSSVTPPRIDLHLSADQELYPITLKLHEVPMTETLRYVAAMAHLNLLQSDDALVLESYFYGKTN